MMTDNLQNFHCTQHNQDFHVANFLNDVCVTVIKQHPKQMILTKVVLLKQISQCVSLL